MLETKARFIPIFCDVKPFELRYPDKGVYAAAFTKHEEKGRFSKERLDQWKASLESSSLISGYEFNTSHDNVERLCTEIALVVQQEAVGKIFKGVGSHLKGLHADEAASTSTSAMLKKSSLLPRDSHPVGIHSKVEHMVGLLEDTEVQVIAVLVWAARGRHFFSKMSTSRKIQVALNSSAQIYEMKTLSDEDSWMLFCIYAFPNSTGNRAPQHREEEGLKIVEQCGNLPLAIKMIAASLANTTLKNWEWKHSQLERVVPLESMTLSWRY
ncbi:hypothetical protein SUGI_1120060 [Cryptomeria japonica]|nr:hypothetical protein SUGI_1120060 [Cryptomeria japonica]